MSDEPVKVCEKCGEPVKRLLFPVAIQFKGSGFYETDYRSESYRKGAEKDSAPSSKPEGGCSGGGCSGFQYGFTFDENIEEGDSQVEWFEGNYSEYEEDLKRRLGDDAATPHRT